MNCRQARRHIPLLAGDDLGENLPGLEAHLASCAACRREAAVYRGLRRAIAAAAGAPSPVDDASFLAGIRRRASAPRLPAEPPAAVFRRLATRAAAAAAVLALVAAGFWLATPGGSPATDPAGLEPGLAATAEVSRPAAETVPAATPEAAPVTFNLSGASLNNGAEDVLLETPIVPDPRAPDGPREREFALEEMQPLLEAEISADF